MPLLAAGTEQRERLHRPVQNVKRDSFWVVDTAATKNDDVIALWRLALERPVDIFRLVLVAHRPIVARRGFLSQGRNPRGAASELRLHPCVKFLWELSRSLNLTQPHNAGFAVIRPFISSTPELPCHLDRRRFGSAGKVGVRH